MRFVFQVTGDNPQPSQSALETVADEFLLLLDELGLIADDASEVLLVHTTWKGEE